MTESENWLDWKDRDGTKISLGDFISMADERNAEVVGQSGKDAHFLHLECNDGKPFRQWLYSPSEVQKCLRNPILSPNP